MMNTDRSLPTKTLIGIPVQIPNPLPRFFWKQHWNEYTVWRGIRNKCSNPKVCGWQSAGAKGIGVCSRWEDFSAFLSDMGKRPALNAILKRVDIELDFTPQNCVWVIYLPKPSRPPRTNYTTNPKTKSTYDTWRGMLYRCYNPNINTFRWYGAKGITVCDRWRESFDNFVADMGLRPLKMTLDRWPDSYGNYEPGNCRWATSRQQQNNRTNNRLITFGGITLTLSQWAEQNGLDCQTLSARLRRGRSVEEALTLRPLRGVSWELRARRNQLADHNLCLRGGIVFGGATKELWWVSR